MERPRYHGYLEAGHAVARRCDLLIAIWDGKPAKGIGGTADVIAFSLRNGSKVLWIPITRPDAESGREARAYPPVWLERLAAMENVLVNGHVPPSVNDLPRDVKEYLELRLLPKALSTPQSAANQDDGLWHRIEAVVAERPISFPEFQQPPPPGRSAFPVWTDLFSTIRDALAGKTGQAVENRPSPAAVTSSGTFRYHTSAYEKVDGLAVQYGDRYRSAYVQIFAFGALALCVAAVAVAWHGLATVATFIELVLLGLIAWVFSKERRFGWHRRWLVSRLLAELFRQTRTLALLGRGLPAEHPAAARYANEPTEDWLVKYVRACDRAAPFNRPLVLSGDWLREVHEYLCSLVGEQIDYHRANAKRCKEIADRLGRYAFVAFAATLFVVMLKFLFLIFTLEPKWLSTLFGMLAIALPAVAAALFALRQQSEFEVLEQRSRMMQDALGREKALLASDRFDVQGPLAAVHLGRSMVRIADLMISDLAEWSLVFKVKIVELS